MKKGGYAPLKQHDRNNALRLKGLLIGRAMDLSTVIKKRERLEKKVCSLSLWSFSNAKKMPTKQLLSDDNLQKAISSFALAPMG